MDDPRARRPAGSDSRGAKSDGKGFGEAVRLPTPFMCIGARYEDYPYRTHIIFGGPSAAGNRHSQDL